MENKIYTHNSNTASLGIYVSEDGGQTLIVEVKKRSGSAMYTFLVNGHDIARNHYTASEAYEELSEYLSATVVELKQSELKKAYSEYKEALEVQKVTRRKAREAKKKKNEVYEDDYVAPRVFGV